MYFGNYLSKATVVWLMDLNSDVYRILFFEDAHWQNSGSFFWVAHVVKCSHLKATWHGYNILFSALGIPRSRMNKFINLECQYLFLKIISNIYNEMIKPLTDPHVIHLSGLEKCIKTPSRAASTRKVFLSLLILHHLLGPTGSTRPPPGIHSMTVVVCSSLWV